MAFKQKSLRENRAKLKFPFHSLHGIEFHMLKAYGYKKRKWSKALWVAQLLDHGLYLYLFEVQRSKGFYGNYEI